MNWLREPPVVIVEPGSTHEGDKAACLQHINLAADVGATAIKFQWLSNPATLAEQRQAPDYVEAYQKIAFPLAWHQEFQEMAHSRGLWYGCSIYLKDDVARVAPYVDFFKLSSFEADHSSLLFAMMEYEKPVYISLGMKTQAMVDSYRIKLKRWAIGRQVGKGVCPIYLLYCVTGYPCPKEQLNLAVLTTGLYDGFSDHSADVTVGARAFAAGARIFEVHTRLISTPTTNPDFAVSLGYFELRKYIQKIHEQRVYFGDDLRCIQPVEESFLGYQSQLEEEEA